MDIWEINMSGIFRIIDRSIRVEAIDQVKNKGMLDNGQKDYNILGKVKMSKTIINIIYVLAMITTVVTVDILFFRDHFWERLMSNIGIILIYVAFYLAFFRH